MARSIPEPRSRRAVWPVSSIRVERLAAGVTLQELALAARISASDLSLAERELRSLSPEAEIRRARALERLARKTATT